MKQTSRTAVVLSCSQQIPAEKSKKALSKPRKCDSELEKSKKMPSTSNFKPTLLDKKKSVAAACTQTDDIPEEFTFDDASCQTDPVTYEPSWSDVSCQTERSEEATKILLELLGPDYFDWRPKPKKTETPSVLQYDGAANSLTKKQEKCVMKQEDFVVKQQGDTDHDYAAAVTVTDRLLGGAVQVSVKEELDDNCSHAELPKSAVTVQTPVVQSAVSLKSSTFRPSPVIQATICMNSVTRQSPVINPTDITKGSAISQPPVAQTTVCTIPLLQRTTGKTASNPGCKEGKVGTKKRDQEPTEDEADYTDKTDKNDDDYTPWSENESSSESELEKASSSEMDLFSSTDSDSDSLSDCSLKEPVVEHNEDAPLTRRRRSQRLKKKCKPDAVLDQEEEEMDAESEDSAESKEEPGSVSLMCLSPKKYKCKYCSVKFRKKLWMKHHIHLTHLKIKYKPFKCSYENCKKRFILKKKMKEHIKNVHETASNPEEKEFLCGFAGCNKVFRSRQRLNIHVQIHSETRGWVCKECGKTFKLQKCLSMHTKIHTGEKRLQCTVCGELFRQKASLNWHMTKHEESCDSFFKVSCDVCGKKFEKEKGLEAHMVKVHGRTV